MKNALNFLKYNNVVPITLSFVLLGAGSALAASPEVRDAAAAALLSESNAVVSVDNTYIVNKDLAQYSPRIHITAVTEDESRYYVQYLFSTIDVDDYVWRDVEKTLVIEVDKSVLGARGDLGLYVTGQFKQNLWHEGERLKEAQARERQHMSQKVVATTYSGLLGRFLDDTTETLPGYQPVNTVAQSREGATSEGGAGSPEVQSAGSNQDAHTSQPQSARISLQILGNNPARVSIGSLYIDLGVYLDDPYGTNVGVHTFYNGVEVISPNIDTTKPGTHVIEYRATDLNGVEVSAERTVLVGNAEEAAPSPVSTEEAPVQEVSNATSSEASQQDPAS